MKPEVPTSRPAVMAERTKYEPSLPVEEFMVPLLRRHVESAVAAHAKFSLPGGRALDVGCGGQPFRTLLESTGYSYTSLDASQNPQQTVDFVCTVDDPLPTELIQRGPFQFILCTEVLEHVADWRTAFENLAELTTAGSRVLITCPHFYPLHEEPFDFWRPTPHALRYFAGETGFRVLEEKTAGTAWDILGTLLGGSHAVPADNRFLDLMLSKFVSLTRRCLFELLRTNGLQRRVRLESSQGSFYLSNFFILEHIEEEKHHA